MAIATGAGGGRADVVMVVLVRIYEGINDNETSDSIFFFQEIFGKF